MMCHEGIDDGGGMKHVALISLLVAVLTHSALAEECKKITVTGNPEYPPITWKEGKKMVGVAIELLEQAFSEIGIPVEGVYAGPWARAQASVKKGKVDMLAGQYINQERITYMDYVFPRFMLDPVAIFVMRGQSFTFEKWEDLVGLEGGSPIGNSHGEAFDTFAKEKLSIRAFPSLHPLLKAMERGRTRYMVFGLYPGLAEAQKLGYGERIEVLPQHVASEGMYVAFSKKSPCRKYHTFLTRKVNEWVDLKRPEGLVPKYMGLLEK